MPVTEIFTFYNHCLNPHINSVKLCAEHCETLWFKKMSGLYQRQ